MNFPKSRYADETVMAAPAKSPEFQSTSLSGNISNQRIVSRPIFNKPKIEKREEAAISLSFRDNSPSGFSDSSAVNLFGNTPPEKNSFRISGSSPIPRFDFSSPAKTSRFSSLRDYEPTAEDIVQSSSTPSLTRNTPKRINSPNKPPVYKQDSPQPPVYKHNSPKPPVYKQDSPPNQYVYKQDSPPKPPVYKQDSPYKPPIHQYNSPNKPPIHQHSSPYKPPVHQYNSPNKPPVHQYNSPNKPSAIPSDRTTSYSPKKQIKPKMVVHNHKKFNIVSNKRHSKFELDDGVKIKTTQNINYGKLFSSDILKDENGQRIDFETLDDDERIMIINEFKKKFDILEKQGIEIERPNNWNNIKIVESIYEREFKRYQVETMTDSWDTYIYLFYVIVEFGVGYFTNSTMMEGFANFQKSRMHTYKKTLMELGELMTYEKESNRHPALTLAMSIGFQTFLFVAVSLAAKYGLAKEEALKVLGSEFSPASLFDMGCAMTKKMTGSDKTPSKTSSKTDKDSTNVKKETAAAKQFPSSGSKKAPTASFGDIF